MTGADDEQDYDDETTTGDAIVLDLETRQREPEERAWQAMTLDGEVVRVRRPKGAFFVRLARTIANGDELQQAHATEDCIDAIFDPPSQELIRARLEDEEDDFDLDDFGMILNKLRELWGIGVGTSGSGRRPTGGSSGSRARAPRSGRPSTARSRSQE